MLLLNEAYYGKDKILLECEKEINILRRDTNCIGESKNHHKSNIKLQNLLAKKFNVESVIITWIPSITVNAYTRPITSMFDMTAKELKVVRDGKNGVKFKDPKGKIMTISIYEGLAMSEDFTDAELLSIILHEIGHNFFTLQHSFILSKIVFILDVLNFLINELIKRGLPIQTICELITYSFYNTKSGRKVQKNINEKFIQNDKFKDINNVHKIFGMVFNILERLYNDISSTLALPINMLIAPVVGVITIPLFAINELLSGAYTNEKFADNFATSYGYGPESASAEVKLNNYAKITSLYVRPLSDTPVGYMYNICYSFLMFFLSVGGSHPMAMTRINDQIKLLEYELNRPGISKQQRDIIKKDIEKIKKIQQKCTDTSNKVGTEFMNAFIQSSFGGDPRELFLKTTDYDVRDNKVYGWREDIELDYFIDIY